MCIVIGNAQAIFSYGKKTVTKADFLKAFNKNPSPSADRKTALKEYLDLYVNFKLKVQAAYDANLQDDPTQKYELENFKRQIADNIINEEAKVKDLAREAFNRSQKDIQLAQVFIEMAAKDDTTAAYKQIQTAYQALKNGKTFFEVSQEYSNDPFTKQTGGDLGYVTVFTLPYDFENVAYSLPPGTYSAPFKSKLGYHIFKNVTERKGLGRRRVSQILIAFPPGSSIEEKAVAKRKADSVYTLLQSDPSQFANLVKTMSNDVSTANSEGQMSEFGVGQFNPAFEQAAFSLSTPQQLSKPFETNYGYHILKLLEVKPVGKTFDDPETALAFKDKITQDDRLTQAKKMLIEKRLGLIKYKAGVYNQQQLAAYTDSIVNNKKTDNLKGITQKTILFSFAKQNITVDDWSKFVRAVRTAQSELGKKTYPDLMKEYVGITAGEYYRNHLEDYSPQYKQQVQEFKEANLLFGIMDKNVWGKANVDTTGLLAYYNLHKQKYKWLPSATALIVSCGTEQISREVQKRLRDSIQNWRMISESYTNLVTADSGRYELAQLPAPENTKFTPGTITPVIRNESDNTYTFNYILNVYNQQDQRSFDDARGMIISDYQQVLEEKWLNELKKKYPVKVNEALFATIK